MLVQHTLNQNQYVTDTNTLSTQHTIRTDTQSIISLSSFDTCEYSRPVRKKEVKEFVLTWV